MSKHLSCKMLIQLEVILLKVNRNKYCAVEKSEVFTRC